MNQTLKDLQAVRELLAQPERWTQMAYARDAAGSQVPETSTTAVCFCLSGAIWRIIANCSDSAGHSIADSSGRWSAVKNALIPEGAQVSPLRTLTRFNDMEDRSHADILKLLDDTIKRLTDECKDC